MVKRNFLVCEIVSIIFGGLFCAEGEVVWGIVIMDFWVVIRGFNVSLEFRRSNIENYEIKNFGEKVCDWVYGSKYRK